MPRIGIGIGLGRTFYAGNFADAYNTRVLADGGTIEATPCVNAASTLLQSASLLLIPSGYKSGVAYSQLPNNGNGDLTWTRASTANRTNSSGLIESVPSGVPRLSYMYGSCPAALLEPQRTNLALYSEQFDNANWSKTNSNITANTITSPDGNNTADSLIEDTSNGLHYLTQAITVVANTTYTATIYVKSNTRTKGRFRLNDTGGQPATDGNFDLVAQTISTGTITSVGNGWFRLTISRLMGSTSGTFVLFLADSTGAITYSGNGTSGLYLFGAQLEAGSYATTYIPTTTASVTRLADSFTRNNIYTNGLITSAGGTWYVELRNNVVYVRDGTMRFGIGDNVSVSQNALVLIPSVNGRLQVFKYISSIGTSLYTTINDSVKIAIKWNGTIADIFVNGVKVVSATAFTTTNMEYLLNSSQVTPMFIQAMALYNAPLSDTDCVTLTT